MIKYEFSLFQGSGQTASRCVELIRLVHIFDSTDWSISMHQHEDLCEFEYVLSGEGRYVIDSREYTIREGDLIFVNAGTGHAEASSPDNPLRSWKVTCRVAPQDYLAANVILPAGFAPVVSVRPEYRADLVSCCSAIQQELELQEDRYEQMVFLLVQRLFLLATRRIEADGQRLKERHLSLAIQVKRYIDLHYAEKITLEHLAEELHVSKYYLSHEMKKEYQCSPIDYLISRRMGEAQHLLNTTDMPVGEIAKKVGYENISYFNSMFAKRTGKTPTEFREQYD